jgi:hypothetical protein
MMRPPPEPPWWGSFLFYLHASNGSFHSSPYLVKNQVDQHEQEEGHGEHVDARHEIIRIEHETDASGGEAGEISERVKAVLCNSNPDAGNKQDKDDREPRHYLVHREGGGARLRDEPIELVIRFHETDEPDIERADARADGDECRDLQILVLQRGDVPEIFIPRHVFFRVVTGMRVTRGSLATRGTRAIRARYSFWFHRVVT